MKPDLRQLQALVAIARHGVLARAADALHCSPSALSMQLTGLQQRLGLALVRRTGRGLALTADGERLLPAAQEAVAAVDRLVNEADAGSSPATRGGALPPPALVTIGTILDPDAIRLGDFLRAARQRLPQLHPELRHGISGSVLREVSAARLDLGFCLGQPAAGDVAALRVQRLASVRYLVVGPRGWQSRLQGRSWAELAALPWISTPRESVHHQLLAPLFRRMGVRMHSVARVDQEASMLDLVRAGFGLSLAREAVALREADESGLALWRTQPLQTALSLVAPRRLADAAREATVAQLLEIAAQVWPPGA